MKCEPLRKKWCWTGKIHGAWCLVSHQHCCASPSDNPWGTLALTASNRWLATTCHPHFPGNAGNDQPGKSLLINSPHSTQFSYWGMDVPFTSAIGLVSCKKTCEHTEVFYLTTLAAHIIGTFGVVCHESFVVPASLLVLPSLHLQITTQKSSRIAGINTCLERQWWFCFQLTFLTTQKLAGC